MATPTPINSGTNVQVQFGGIDNYIAAYLNPDNAKLTRWAQIFECNSAGTWNTPNASVDITQLLTDFKNNGASSVVLTFIASNFAGGGGINFTIVTPNGKTPVSVNLAEYTAQQWSYQLNF